MDPRRIKIPIQTKPSISSMGKQSPIGDGSSDPNVVSVYGAIRILVALWIEEGASEVVVCRSRMVWRRKGEEVPRWLVEAW